MTLYQVVLNKVDDRTPIFQTRAEAVALIRKYATHMKNRGRCEIIEDQEDRFSAIWGGWEEKTSTMWIREVEAGKIPIGWVW
jgi:hypothetical protein